jgi:tRNA G18 (ribose-2'-O)-methylase SpoU
VRAFLVLGRFNIYNMKQLNFREIRGEVITRLENIDKNRTPIVLLCDRISDVRNVGSIFRIADAARLEKVYFYQSEINFAHKKLAKVARSTNQYLQYESINSLDFIKELSTEYEVIALDKTSESIDYTKFEREEKDKKLLLILGSEQFGVQEDLLKIASQSIHLPMLGVNTSMNLSVATGIAVFHLLTKFSEK